MSYLPARLQPTELDATETDPCLQDSPTSSATMTTSSTEKRSLTSNEKVTKPTGFLLTLDKANLCIVIFLLFTLLFITALIAFVIGQWAARSDSDWSKNDTSSEQTIYDESDEMESSLNLTGDLYPPSGDIFQVFSHYNRNRTTVVITRLPNTVIPTQYNIQLNFTEYQTTELAAGNITIHIKCKVSTSELIFHAAPTIDISMVKLDGKLMNFTRHLRSCLVSLTPNSPLLTGHNYKLFIRFKSRICGEQSGIYCQRSIPGPKKRPQIIAFTTKFEPALAKTLIPCWDEPSFKAIFNLTLTYPENVVLQTNTASYRQTVDKRKGHVTAYFHETPPMSSYLLSFAMGPYVSVERKTKRGLKMAIWTVPEDAAGAEYASQFSIKMVEKMEKHFSVRYAMSKLDMVASRNFPVGGMENWGLIIYHYKMLLVDDKIENNTDPTERLLEKHKISKIICHELVHQWFGNLVTMEWWSELWLNEGFATFYSHLFLPDHFQQMTEYEHMLRLGQLWNKQATSEKLPLIRNDLTTEYKISTAFDQWSLYAKGCVMVRMISDLIGPYNLRRGIVRYLKTNAYSTATRFSLWSAIGNTTLLGTKHLNLEKIMESWLTNPGFPEIHVRRDYNTGLVDVEQVISDLNRHRVYLEQGQMSEANWTWVVPFLYTSNGYRKPEINRLLWVTQSTFSFQDADIISANWMLVNPAMMFPYRISYDIDNWNLLIDQLYKNHLQIPRNSRVQLILDGGFFLRETPNIAVFIRLLGYLSRETEIEPFLYGLDEITRLAEIYQSTKIFPLLIIYFKPVIKRINEAFENEKSVLWHFDEPKQTQLYLIRCAASLPPCEIDRESIQMLISHPTPNHTAMAAACHYYLNNKGESDRFTFVRLLSQNPSKSALLLHLAACVQHKDVRKAVVRYIFQSRNAGFLASILAGGYTLSHNMELRLELWKTLKNVKPETRHMLLRRRPLTRVILYTVRSMEELREAEKVIKGYHADKLLLRKQLHWHETTAVPILEQWFIKNVRHSVLL